ncbi:MAG: TIR domain-containing protein [Gammaproteobacteria bacterium]|jgi:hypothetical protein|nr:TIR domain-containing protein [Gammaproteobacteria bacterium]
MPRRVFFSFHYQNDNWRVAQVRNSWLFKDKENGAPPFYDAADWESIKKGGDAAIKYWIDTQLKGTSVTVVLIGAETAGRKYVEYEIIQSHNAGKGILGIYIHQLKDRFGATSKKGRNPLEYLSIGKFDQRRPLSHLYTTYDWQDDNGYQNMPMWIERAAARAKLTQELIKANV